MTIPYDATAHFYPQLQFLARALHSGDLPFWAPNIFAGSPQIADPQSLIFSPAFLLAYFNPAPSLRAFDAYVFVIILAGCFAVLMLFRDRGWHPAAAVLAALAFGFGASANARIQHVGQIQGLVFFMIALWLLARALDRRSMIYGALSGVSAGFMVVEPGQVQLLGCYFLAGYAVSHWLLAENVRNAFRRSVPPLLVAGTITVVLAALPLLFTFLFGNSASRAAIPFKYVGAGSLHPASLLTAFVTDLFGANDPAVPYWGPGSNSWQASSWGLAQNMSQSLYRNASDAGLARLRAFQAKTSWRGRFAFSPSRSAFRRSTRWAPIRRYSGSSMRSSPACRSSGALPTQRSSSAPSWPLSAAIACMGS